MINGGPVFTDYIKELFEGKTLRKLYRVYVIVLAVAVFISWPSNPITYYIQFTSKPITYTLGFMLMFLFSYLYSLTPEFSDQRGRNTVVDWIFYTPVDVVPAYAGYLAATILHVLFPLLTALPLLLIAATASGLSAETVVLSLVVVFLYCLFSKQFLQFLLMVFNKRSFLRILLFAGFLMFTILLSVRILPVSNPVLAAQTIISGEIALDSQGLPIYPSWQNTAAVYGMGILITTVASALSLAIVRREARRAQ